MAPPSSELMLQVMTKLPLFRGFSPTQLRLILGACEHRALQAGDEVCVAGAEAAEVVLLVAGELSRTAEDGTPTSRILPVASIGEVEVLTGRAHAQAVRATKGSHLFTVPRFKFERMLRRDPDAQLKVYRNLVGQLADATRNAEQEERLAELERQRSSLEGRVAVLERQLRQQAQKVEAAYELLTARAEISRDEAEIYIGEKLKGLVPRVLIVDDEPEFRRFVREALASFMVVEAASGREALEIVQDERLDLIIADIRMPEMDGCTLLDNLRSKWPGLPVLGVSGYLGADDVRNYGFDGFLDKPMGLQCLQQAVEVALAGRN